MRRTKATLIYKQTKNFELFKYYWDIQSLKVQLGIWESKLMTLLKCLKTSRFETLNTPSTYVADVPLTDSMRLERQINHSDPLILTL
jgi:hypothetical protein